MGIILDPLERLKHTLASCVHVASWMGYADGATEEQVAQRIYLDGISTPDSAAETLTPEQQKQLRPYIILYPSSDAGYTFTRDGSPNCWHGSGMIIAVLSREYAPELSIDAHFREAAASIEKILSSETSGQPGILEMANFAEFLAVNKVQVYFEGRTPTSEIANYGDAYDVVLILEYGGA